MSSGCQAVGSSWYAVGISSYGVDSKWYAVSIGL